MEVYVGFCFESYWIGIGMWIKCLSDGFVNRDKYSIVFYVLLFGFG